MKYLLLAGSVVFGISGITQAMDAIHTAGSGQIEYASRVIHFQPLAISLSPLPGYVQILLLSLGFFCLFLIWKKLKDLGMGKITEYTPE